MSEQEQPKSDFVEGFAEAYGQEAPPPSKWGLAALFTLPAAIFSLVANLLTSDLINDGFQNRTVEALGKTGAKAETAAEGVRDYLKKAKGRGAWVAGIGLVAMAGSAIYGWFTGKKLEEIWDKNHHHHVPEAIKHQLNARMANGRTLEEFLEQEKTLSHPPATSAHTKATLAVTEAAPAGRVQEAPAQQITT